MTHQTTRNRRRRGLASALAGLALAAAALPSAASAAEVDVPIGGPDQLNVVAAPGEVNRARVSDDGTGFVRIHDEAGLVDSTSRCVALSSTEVRCSVNPATTAIVLRQGDRDDRAEVASTIRVGIDAGAGNDTYAGGLVAGRSTVLFRGGPNADTASYADATAPVVVGLGDGRPGDGRANDADEIADAERIIGSRFGDRLDASVAQPFVHAALEGGAGNDILVSGEGRDLLIGGLGIDFLSSRGDIDRIDARDNERDTVDCGAGTPDETLVSRDGESSTAGCERIVPTRPPATNNGGLVGTLRLTPQAQRVPAGESARVHLAWRHPRGWRALRRIELRLVRGGEVVARVALDPRRGRASDGSRLVRRGRSVRARLALRLGEALAGARLRIEVVAVDARGRRQLERHAGSIRVLGAVGAR